MSHSEKTSLAATIKQRLPFRTRQQEVYLSVVKTASDLSHSTDQFLRQYGVTQIQYNVLRILLGAGPSGLGRNEIAERMVTAAPDMSRLLDRMERDGLVSRARNRKDRRQVGSTITRAGEALLARVEAPLIALHEQQLRGLSASNSRLLLRLLSDVRSEAPGRS